MKQSRLLLFMAVFSIAFGLKAQTVIEDFEGDLSFWTATGDAFEIIDCPGVATGFVGSSALTSLAGHCAGYTGAPQEDLTGTLTSPEIDLTTNRMRFLIGGGNNPGVTGIKLTVDGVEVHSAAGPHNGAMAEVVWDITAYKGQKGIIEIFDNATSPTGYAHIHIDHIELFEIVESVPDAPTTVSALPVNEGATISFAAPASDGGSPITSYTATSSPEGVTASSATSPISISGLTNGVSYTFTVTATNALGTSVASVASNAVIPELLIWDERPTTTFGTDYEQDFTGGTWDQTTFDTQWQQVGPMDAAAIADGYLNLMWVDRRIIVANEKQTAPYVVESEIQAIPGDATYCATPIIIRANVDDNQENPQEPATGGVVNRTGIALYPKEGDYNNTMIVQFTNADYSSQAKIDVPKPAGLTSLTDKYTLRIEDYETSVYVFINNAPFVRIDLGDENDGIYTSGVVYDANMSVMGNFSGMKVDASGKVAFATRGSQLNIYNMKIGGGTIIEPVPVIIEDFEGDLSNWTVTGNAFEIISCVGVTSGFEGSSALTSLAGHCAGYTGNPMEDLTGTLTSSEIDLTRNRMRFLIGGGNNPGVTGIKLTVGGVEVHSAAGPHNGAMAEVVWDITAYKGQKGIIEIFDNATSPTGYAHIHIDQIELFEIVESVPDAPTTVSALPVNEGATISFAAPASDGGSTITSYTATSSPEGVTASSSTSPISVSGLTNGISYTFTVTATNALGTSVASVASNAVIPELLIWDERPTTTFGTDYEQDFTGGTWDQTTFDTQWQQVGPMDAAAIADGYLNLMWIDRRIIVANEKQTAPYVVESEIQAIPGDATYCATPIIIRANVDDNQENPQEPATGGIVNRTGIALYPKEGDYNNTMIVQFTNADYTSSARIEVPKPAALTSLTDKYTLRIEDYETSVYIYINTVPFVRIDLGGLNEGVYSSGVVYDANMVVMGNFSGMKVDASGKVAFATRGSQLNIYNMKIMSESGPLGVDELNRQDALEIYTTTSEKVVYINGVLNDATSVEIFDIQGRKIVSRTLNQNSSSNRIDLSHIKTGIYIVRLSSNGINQTKKVFLF